MKNDTVEITVPNAFVERSAYETDNSCAEIHGSVGKAEIKLLLPSGDQHPVVKLVWNDGTKTFQHDKRQHGAVRLAETKAGTTLLAVFDKRNRKHIRYVQLLNGVVPAKNIQRQLIVQAARYLEQIGVLKKSSPQKKAGNSKKATKGVQHMHTNTPEHSTTVH